MQNDQNQLNTQSAADIDLVQSAKQGDISAFEELVRRHTKRVFAIASHITRSREDAEEVSQETFLKACRHLKGFEGKAQFGTWLTRIAVNTALTKVSQPRFVQIGDEESDSELSSMAKEVPDWRPNPEELYGQYQLRQRLRQALEQLPRLYSTVFLLRDMQGLSVTETAAALRLSIPTVKTRLLRARLQLREILSKSFITTWTEAEHARSNLVARVPPLAAHSVDSRSERRAQLVPPMV
jgi:RNA polymerase sigma-70 factor (ECF subfamily)